MPDGGSIAERVDFDLGPIRVRPAMRALEGPGASVSVEPLVMQLLVTLSRRAGKLVTRRQAFDACWGAAAVGDDSLNRIVAVLRKALRDAPGDAVQIETVPATGYVLRFNPAPGSGDAAGKRGPEEAIAAGYDSWRLGLPEPDHLRLELLRRATADRPDEARAWGMLALLCRQATEYAEPADVGGYVAECQAAARRALAIDPKQGEALVALASVAPLYARWRDARRNLTEALDQAPGHIIAVHDLAMLEMATGRVRAAIASINALIERDRLAACVCYKATYQRWSTGDLAGMDEVSDRAIHLWPTHPAVWSARFWTLAHTGRAHAALAMLDDPVRPAIPPPALRLLRLVIEASLSGNPASVDIAAKTCTESARMGPAQALGALNALGLLKRVDQAFAVASAYYLRAGEGPVPVRHSEHEPSINDQHRRVTQVLFTPACAAMRADPRFLPLCERMGLTRYWDETGLTPDFLAGDA